MQEAINKFKEGGYKALVIGCNSTGELCEEVREIIKAFPMVKFAHLNYKKAMTDLVGEAATINMMGTLAIEHSQYGDIVLAYTKDPDKKELTHGGMWSVAMKLKHIYYQEDIIYAKKTTNLATGLIDIVAGACNIKLF